MALFSANEIKNIWAQLMPYGKIYADGNLPSGAYDGDDDGAHPNYDYNDPAAYSIDAAAVSALALKLPNYAAAITGADTIGEAALAVNLAFLALGNEYVEYLKTNPPILDIAKDRGPSHPGQSFTTTSCNLLTPTPTTVSHHRASPERTCWMACSVTAGQPASDLRSEDDLRRPASL